MIQVFDCKGPDGGKLKFDIVFVVSVLPFFHFPWLPLINSKLYIFCCVQTMSGVIAVGTSHGLALVFGESKPHYPLFTRTLL